MDVKAFYDGYRAAIIFAELLQDGSSNDYTCGDAGYSINDFDCETQEDMYRDCVSFLWDMRRTIRKALATGYSMEQAGMDFYFTSAGHGVGYWDRGLGELGDTLSNACRRREYNVFPLDGYLRIE